MGLFNLFGSRTKTLSMDNSVPGPYTDYVNQFSSIVSVVGHSQKYLEGCQAYVNVRYIDAERCEVECSINNDFPFPENLRFGGPFRVNGEWVFFRTENATGFQDPETVGKTVIRLMTVNNSSVYRVRLLESSIIGYGDYTGTPLVTCRFSFYAG